MNEYLIYPEAQIKLKKNGLENRIKKLYEKKDRPCFIGATYEDDIVNSVKYLKEDGFLKTFPKSEEKYKNNLNNFFLDKSKEEIIWTINKKKYEISENWDKPEQILLYTGYYNSFILNPDEIWDYKKFGFNSLSEFIGTVGVSILEENRTSFKEGLIWNYKDDKFVTLESNITGTMHGDLTIYQTDLTNYQTIDPFNNRVFFRPITQDDRYCVRAYHSNEPLLLIGILKYIHQEKIKSDLLSNPKEFNNWIGKLSKRGGNFADAGCGGSHPEILFNLFKEIKMQKLDNEMKFKGRPYSRYGVSMQSEGFFGMYIQDEKLIFSRTDLNKDNIVSNIFAKFYPQEVDDILRGIFYQVASGLGRSSITQVKDILNHYLENFHQK